VLFQESGDKRAIFYLQVASTAVDVFVGSREVKLSVILLAELVVAESRFEEGGAVELTSTRLGKGFT